MPAGDLFGDPEEEPERRKRGVHRSDDHRLGHRDRLRARFNGGGEAAVTEYELLELILFRAIPRRDVKPLAKALIAEFGDLGGVLEADRARLEAVDGLGPAVATELKIVAAAGRGLARSRLTRRIALNTASAVMEYCQAALARHPVEAFRVLFFDRKNGLIADEQLTRGTVDKVAVYPREVVKRALELSATAVILVHNHPSGDPEPSKADIALTKTIADAAQALEVAVHDHIVVGATGAVSLRARGLL